LQFCIRRQNHENVTTAPGGGEMFLLFASTSDVEQIGLQLSLVSLLMR